MCCHSIGSASHQQEETESLRLSLNVSMETQSEDWDSPVQVHKTELQENKFGFLKGSDSGCLSAGAVAKRGNVHRRTCPSDPGGRAGRQPSHGRPGGRGGPGVRQTAGLRPSRRWDEAGRGFLDSAHRRGPAGPRAHPRILQGEDLDPDRARGRGESGENS